MKSALLLLMISLLTTSVFANDISRFCNRANNIKKAIDGKMRPRSRTLYKGCQKDMPWMKQTREVICQNKAQEIDLPEVFYFSFDGAADFNANLALEVDPSIANLSGNEGRDLYAGNFNGGREILPSIQEMSEGFTYESRYYASSGVHLKEHYQTALVCFRQIDEYLDAIESAGIPHKRPLMATIGYSNGGIDSLKLQHTTPKKFDRAFDIVLTVDPIAKAHKYHVSKLRSYSGEKNEATGVLLNFYQDVDFESLGDYVKIPFTDREVYIGFKFKGKPIYNADLNHHFTLENNAVFEARNGAYAHLYIIGAYAVWENFHCELEHRRLNLAKEEIPACQTDNILDY